jgi:RHS repeat-associated protein
VAADAVRLVPAPAADGYYVHTDHLGSPQAMTDDAQDEVWRIDTRPFGEVEALTWTVENNQRFPGQYSDAESGYSYNYFRDYDPTIGRYLQSDPIGLAGGINTFAYVGGNPVGAVDPTGENPVLIAGLVGGGLSPENRIVFG